MYFFAVPLYFFGLFLPMSADSYMTCIFSESIRANF